MVRWLAAAALGAMVATGARADLREDCASAADVLVRVELCTRLIKTEGLPDTDRALAHSNRGLAYERLGRLRRALEDYETAVGLDPALAPAYNNRGNVHAALGNLEQALADHSRAVELAPDYAHAYYNRGLDYEELGEGARAIEDYTRTLELDPDYDAARVSRGSLACRLGRVEQAMADFAEAVERGVIAPDRLQERLQARGHYDGAIDGVFGPGSRAALRAWVEGGCRG